jgi:glycosyltransferase involved in cell wall biosynthesis
MDRAERPEDPDRLSAARRSTQPDLSLVLPCYNEAAMVGHTVGDLLQVFDREGIALELVLVNNGSVDSTGEVLAELAADPRVQTVQLSENAGYGGGVLAGLERCRGRLIGFITADAEVEAWDVLKVYRVAASSPHALLAKVRRRFRSCGWVRLVVSVVYNVGANVLFGRLGSVDLNGNPKILPRSALMEMRLASRDWFLDAEVMLKARAAGIPVYELNVISQARRGGRSNVTLRTCWEFVKNLARVRVGQLDYLRVSRRAAMSRRPADASAEPPGSAR